jgi:hypothetical protein
MIPNGNSQGKGGKASLDDVIQCVLAALKRSRGFVAVADLAEQAGASLAVVRKALQAVSTVLTETPCPQGYFLELEWTAKGAIAAACLGFALLTTKDAGSLVAYEMGHSDAEAVARVACAYIASPRVLSPDNSDVQVLLARFPALLTRSASGNGIVPDPSLLLLAEQVRRYGSLGKLPPVIQIPVGTVTFKGELLANKMAEVQPA